MLFHIFSPATLSRRLLSSEKHATLTGPAQALIFELPQLLPQMRLIGGPRGCMGSTMPADW